MIPVNKFKYNPFVMELDLFFWNIDLKRNQKIY